MLRRGDVEPFGTILADLVRRAATSTFQAVVLYHDLDARQMCRKRCTLRVGRPAAARPEASFLIRLVLQALGLAKPKLNTDFEKVIFFQ
jgi:hypothetical protein